MITVVYGENHNNTLGLVRSLGEKGYEVILLLVRRKINYVDKSRYVKQVVYLDPDSDVISIIKTVASEMNEKPILFASGDDEASLIDSHFVELSEYVIPEGGRKNNDINLYRDKNVSNKLAIEIGFNLPKTWVVSEANFLPDGIVFPVMVKANNSIYGGKSVLTICKSEDELKEWLSTLPGDDFPIQVQEYIDKEYEIMLQGCSLYNGAKVFCEVANRRVRTHPYGFGACSYSYSVRVEGDMELMRLRGLVSHYLETIGYSGLFSAEFLYKKGIFYFLEVNLRNDGTSYLSTACGCNLPDIYCKVLSGQNVGQLDYKPQKYMNAIADLHNIGKHVCFCKWFKQLLYTHCYSHFNKRDIKPYFFFLVARWKK